MKKDEIQEQSKKTQGRPKKTNLDSCVKNEAQRHLINEAGKRSFPRITKSNKKIGKKETTYQEKPENRGRPKKQIATKKHTAGKRGRPKKAVELEHRSEEESTDEDVTSGEEESETNLYDEQNEIPKEE